jgi:hypothetical protein
MKEMQYIPFFHRFQKRSYGMKLRKLENQINFSHCSLHLFGFVFSIHVVRTVRCSAGGTEGALCVEMGFYADISFESRCNIEINV